MTTLEDNMEYMDNLLNGIRGFKETYFKKEEELFKQLSQKQAPKFFLITCVDSRIDPGLITRTKPGDIFVLRNVGNIVPPYDAPADKNSAAAALEFAVLGLKVTDIIVCGHSNCGAMNALYKKPEELGNMPHLRDWLKIAANVKDSVASINPGLKGNDCQRMTEEQNILLQLKNIQTYSFIETALKEGAIRLHGWYYDIGAGDILVYNASLNTFEKAA